MRIIGYLETKGYKTTVFKNNDKFIIKFESDLFEQTFKFREQENIENLNDIKALVDPLFLKKVEEGFLVMYENSDNLLKRYHEYKEDTWEEII